MFRITSILIILLINSLSASRSINTNGPQTPLVFKEEPALYTLAHGPVFLHCLVVLDVDDKVFLQDHLTDSSELYHDSYEEVDEYKDEILDSNQENSEEIRKRYMEQMNEQKIQYIQDSNDDYDSNIPFYGRSRRNVNYLGKVFLTWIRNGERLLTTATDPSEDTNGFKIFTNGTLKIKMTNQTAGSYRCAAKHSLYNIGAIISREAIVEEPDIVKVISTPLSVQAGEGGSVVLICPIKSQPAANFTWYFNSSLIEHHGYKRDNRLFLLSNGSLLLTNARMSDAGKYRCNATNTFHRKRYRTAHILLAIFNDSMDRKLLPSLQNKIQMITTGSNLVLFCAASDSAKISWSFKPRNGNVSIQLLNFKEELKFVKVSMNNHDGTYVCSINDNRNNKFDYQSFDVTVMTTPSFYHKIESVTLPVAATIAFNCSASGNPKPTIQWYKNGKLIVNSFVRHSKEGILRIESVEPEDEGIYQCFAGSVSMSNYLMVRKTSLSPSLKNVQCYPMDNNSILVTFDTVHGITVDLVSYFIATNSSWIAPAPISMEKNEKYFIFWNNLKVLSPFGLFMRGFSAQSSGDTFAMTRLLHGRDCSTQGLEPHFIKSPDGIFLWWSIDDESIHVTSFIIQLWYNEKIPDQQNEASCSFYQWSSQYMLWSDIGSTLKNTSIVTRSRPLESLTENVTIIELHLPGNATGILIPNTKQIKVRILGSVDGKRIDRLQLTFLSWHLINASTPNSQMEAKSIEVLNTDARSITINWTGYDEGLCLKVCYQEIAKFIDRGTMRSVNCKQILKDSTMFTVRNLQPQTYYDVFLTICSTTTPISKVLSIGTLEDVPGPVADVTGRDNDGIRIYWKPPRNSNGVIDHYALEWENPRDHQTQIMKNVSCCKFQFPNTINGDRFNVTIRAIGVTGTIGNPHYLDLKKAMMNGSRRLGTSSDSLSNLWNEKNFVILFGALFLVLAIIGAIILVVYLNRRQYLLDREIPKKAENKLNIHPVNGAVNSKMLLESQKLIQRSNAPAPQVDNYIVNNFYHLDEDETSQSIIRKHVINLSLDGDSVTTQTIQNNWNFRRPLFGPNG